LSVDIFKVGRLDTIFNLILTSFLCISDWEGRSARRDSILFLGSVLVRTVGLLRHILLFEGR